MKSKKKNVLIEWEELKSPDDIESTDSGIYQFYGDHFVYGENVLLYIGQTDKKLKGRLSRHEYLDIKRIPKFFNPQKIKVRIGHVTYQKKVALTTIEGLLIFTHNPAWNSSKIRNYYDKYKNVRIENNGDRGDLKKIIDGEEINR